MVRGESFVVEVRHGVDIILEEVLLECSVTLRVGEKVTPLAYRLAMVFKKHRGVIEPTQIAGSFRTDDGKLTLGKSDCRKQQTGKKGSHDSPRENAILPNPCR